MSNLFWNILVKLATWKGAEKSQKVNCCLDVKELQAAETSWKFFQAAETNCKQSQLVKTSVQSNSKQEKESWK